MCFRDVFPRCVSDCARFRRSRRFRRSFGLLVFISCLRPYILRPYGLSSSKGKTLRHSSKALAISHYCLTFTLQSRENTCKAKVAVERRARRKSVPASLTQSNLDAQRKKQSR